MPSEPQWLAAKDLEFKHDDRPFDKAESLYDLLRSALPPLGKAYSQDALKEMKESTPTELGVQKLEVVAYCPALFDNLLELATIKAKRVSIDWKEDADFFFGMHATPGVAASLLPSTIWDEEDVRRYCRYTIINPALLGYHALVRKGGTSFILDGETVYPNVASATHHKIIPDDVIIVGQQEQLRIVGTIEYKAPRVHEAAGFQGLMVSPQNARVGVRAMRFIWPTDISQVQGKDHVQTRMFIQVWAQMCNRSCEYAIHSCGEYTILFIKDENTLYMSKKYGYESKTALAVFGLLLVAAGKPNGAGSSPITRDQLNLKQWKARVDAEKKAWPKEVKQATEATAVGVYLGN